MTAEDLPEDEAPDEGATTEIDDEPMGVPADGDSSVDGQPGIPDEGEPPASG